MAVRITHTNNSQGHDGTYVYRSTSPMDPQNLPAPIADEAPVALGETFEYIDNGASDPGDYYYRTQDHEGGQVSIASSEAMITIAASLSNAAIGDEVEGGIYAGIITYADARQFHIIFGKQEAEVFGVKWKTSATGTPNTKNHDDGAANTQAMIDAGINDHPAAKHCIEYTGGGHTDWYMPARNELALEANLRGHPELSTDTAEDRWAATEADLSPGRAWYRKFSNGAETYSDKDNSFRYTRPVRRVAV